MNRPILFQNVGVSKGLDSGLIKVWDEVSPCKVVLIMTDKSLEANGRALIKEAGRRGMDCAELLLRDPEKIDIVQGVIADAIRKHVDCGGVVSDIRIDITAGTKPMSAAAALVAVEYGLKIYYVTGERQEGRVLSGTEQVVSLATGRYIAERTLAGAASAYRSGNYQASSALAAEARNLYGGKRYAEAADALEALAAGYSRWEAFHYRPAADALEGALRLPAVGRWELTRKIGLSVKLLKEIAEEQERIRDDAPFKPRSEAFAIDLVESARRRISHGFYDDAVARLYRCVEYLSQLALSRDFDQPTSGISMTFMKDVASSAGAEFRRRFEEKQRMTREGRKYEVGLQEGFEILAAKGHSLGLAFVGKKAEFQKLLYKRNHSCMGHGMILTKEETAQSFLGMIEGFARMTVTRFDDMLEQARFAELPNSIL